MTEPRGLAEAAVIGTDPAAPRQRSLIPAWWDEHPVWMAALLVACVAVASSFTGLWNGFAYDDNLLIRENPRVRTVLSPIIYFTESYWGPVADSASLYRPVAVLGWALQWSVADGAPWVFHAVNILLYAVVSVSLLYFLRQLVGPGAAAVGAVVFAAHPLHVEAVANVVGQSELIVASLLLSGVALYARDRRLGALRLRTVGWILAGFLLGLFTKEHAIVLPALLVCVEWAGRGSGFAPIADAWQTTRRLVLILGLIAVTYLAWRAQVLGAVTGDLPHWAVRDRSVGERTLIMLGVLPHIVRLFVFPARLYADYAPAHVAVLPEPALGHVPGLLLLSLAVAGVVLAWRRGWALPVMAAAWFIVTFSPTSNIPFPIGVILAERTLFLPSVAVAVFVAWGSSRAAAWPALYRAWAVSLLLSAVIFGAIHSAVRTRVWTDNPTLFSTLAVEAPTNFRGQMALAGYNSSGGRWAVADSLYRVAVSLYPEHAMARLSYVKDLQGHGEFGAALVQARHALETEPDNPAALVSEALSLLHFQRFREARSRLVAAAGFDGKSPVVVMLRTVVDSMLAATDSVDARNRFVREGRNFDPWTVPLAVRVTPELRRRLNALQPDSRSAIPVEPVEVP